MVRATARMLNQDPGSWLLNTISDGSLVACLRSALACWYRYILLQGEVEQRFTRYLHLIASGDDFRACAGRGAHARADRRSFAAAGNGSDERAKSCSADGSLCGARTARLAGNFIFPGH